VSRARHFGYGGARVKGALQRDYFARHTTSGSVEYAIGRQVLDRLPAPAYDAWLKRMVSNSTATSFNFCKYSLPYGKDPLAVFVQHDGELDHDQHVTATLRCLGAWSLYAARHGHAAVPGCLVALRGRLLAAHVALHLPRPPSHSDRGACVPSQPPEARCIRVHRHDRA